jgi:hypothetical protein
LLVPDIPAHVFLRINGGGRNGRSEVRVR